MADPAKDYQIKKDREARERTRENYEPVVLWVKTTSYLDNPKGRTPPLEVLRKEWKERASQYPFIKVASHDPHIKQIVTEFDVEGDIITTFEDDEDES